MRRGPGTAIVRLMTILSLDSSFSARVALWNQRESDGRLVEPNRRPRVALPKHFRWCRDDNHRVKSYKSRDGSNALLARRSIYPKQRPRLSFSRFRKRASSVRQSRQNENDELFVNTLMMKTKNAWLYNGEFVNFGEKWSYAIEARKPNDAINNHIPFYSRSRAGLGRNGGGATLRSFRPAVRLSSVKVQPTPSLPPPSPLRWRRLRFAVFA